MAHEKNAWGNLSYAELISKAITTSAEQRLTLSEIYDWMIKYVPFFRNKVDRTSSAGWKNSIRHNLSLHNRFKRVQSEGTGKSSWWMINPDDKTSTSNSSSPSHSGTKQIRRRPGQTLKNSMTTNGKRLRPGRSSKSNARLLTSNSQNEVQQQQQSQQKSSTTSVIASRDIPVVHYEDQSSWVNQSENDLTTNPLYEQGLYSTSVNTPSTSTSTGNSTTTNGTGGGGCLSSTFSYDDVTSNYIGNNSNSNNHTGEYSSYHHFHSHHPQTLYQHHHASTYPLNSRNGYYQATSTPNTTVTNDSSSNVNCSLSLDTYHSTNPSSYSLSQQQQQQSQVTTDSTDEHPFLRVHSSSSHSPNSSLSPPTNATNLVTTSSSSGSTHKPSSSSSSTSSGSYLHPTSNGTLTLYSHHHHHQHHPHQTHLSHSQHIDMETFLQLNAETDDLEDDEDLSTLVHHPGLIDDQQTLASFYSNTTQQHHSQHPHAHHLHHHLPQQLHHHNTHNQNHPLFPHHDTSTSILRTVLKRPILDMHNQQV